MYESHLEKSLESALINQLTSGISQWTYRPDIKTEDDLWSNFRKKLNQNNLAVLKGVEITDREMDAIKAYMCEQASSSYKAAMWLAGEHGIAQIPLVREDASLGEVMLMAINNREVAGGRSSYEVINQYTSYAGERQRRFDVTLLINGIPLIHVELKSRSHPYMDAFRQITKYCKEAKFRGLFSFVQMFVVSNESETRYIAANINGEMGEKFLTPWVDENNKPVNGCLDFAREALNIPMAHLMVGKYAVIDEANRRQVILRPYQIHAIRRVREATRKGQSGYVWHTTGSGKTLTSYTVTKNLLDIPAVDKAIFLIDRRDLDRQTSDDFMSYAKNDDIDVDRTGSTLELEEKLLQNTKTAIVTTVQKMQNIIRKYSGTALSKKDEAKKEKLKNKRLAFVVDECHRTVSPITKKEIDKFFGSTLKPNFWFGFTGTPIFAENKKAAVGNLARTTEELYGPVLHKYTIKEAIHDGSVLGFQIQTMGKGTETLQELAVNNNICPEEKLMDMSEVEIEQEVVRFCETRLSSLHDNDQHRENVIDYIVNKSSGKLNLGAGLGNSFSGILTCSSIREAQQYYKLFKKFISEGKVSESIRSKIPDFPKIAITYTVGENEEGDLANQGEMKLALEDYKKMFPEAPASLDDLSAYNADLNKRLARKSSRYRNRKEQLDLVIVVDRLLTGFDAPCMSTIFLDRPPMQPQHLIQAFSRTNRIFNKTKRYGQIVTLQFPALYTKKIDEALLLYSNGGTAEVSAPDWSTTKRKLKSAISELKKIAANKKAAEGLTDIDQLKDFVRAYQKVDRLFTGAQVYDEYEEGDTKGLGMTIGELRDMAGFYANAIEKIREYEGGNDKPEVDPEPIDLDYDLEAVRLTEVNYTYLINLIQSFVPEDEDKAGAVISAEEEARVEKYIALYKKTNPVIGSILDQVWMELRMSPGNFLGKDLLVVVQNRISEIREDKLSKFSREWAVPIEEVRALADIWNGGVVPELNGRFDEYQGEEKLTKLRYKKMLRQAAENFFPSVIAPLSNY